MKTETEQLLSNESLFVIEYFKANKLQRVIIKQDDRQLLKLDGIQSACNNGWLTAKKHPLTDDYIIRATNKLIETYKSYIKL